MNHLTKKSNQAIEKNKELFKAFCEKHNLSKVELEYDGCGDSGQLEATKAYDKDGGQVDLPNEPCTLYTSHLRWDLTDKGDGGLYWSDPEEETSDTVNLTETIAYMALEDHYSGWEINSGSFGVVAILADGSGRIEYNERIEEIEYLETSF